jgi:hypothetical protein
MAAMPSSASETTVGVQPAENAAPPVASSASSLARVVGAAFVCVLLAFLVFEGLEDALSPDDRAAHALHYARGLSASLLAALVVSLVTHRNERRRAAQLEAEVGRRGFEAEASYRIPLTGVFASGAEPVLNWLQPAVRYSTIDNRFEAPLTFVAPSVAWDWAKPDLGLRLGIPRNLDLTVEYARHDMKTRGGTLHPDEALVTLWVSL